MEEYLVCLPSGMNPKVNERIKTQFEEHCDNSKKAFGQTTDTIQNDII